MKSVKYLPLHCGRLLAACLLLFSFKPLLAQDFLSQGACILSPGDEVNPPDHCAFTAFAEPMRIIDGLPPGTTIDILPLYQGVFCRAPQNSAACVTEPGGNLGGERHLYDSVLTLDMRGTGDLDGFRRIITMDLTSELHSGPRNEMDPIQVFPIDLFVEQGQLFGDQDFAQLQIVSGTGFGLPSPGNTTLTQLPGGNFNADSFIDFAYQIDFQGAPGGALAGLAGSTQGLIRRQAVGSERPCIAPDNGMGSVDLPAINCDFRPGTVVNQIINGLPPGTTIDLTQRLANIVCTGPGGACSQPGGNLGGERHTFDALLIWQLRGTGSLIGYHRTLRVPVSVIADSSPRLPISPVQAFTRDLVDLQGALPAGDPDFDMLSIIAGSSNGLPGRGATALTDLGDGTFQIDSFFDIEYTIDFVGAPGSILDGLSGSSTAVSPLVAREQVNTPVQDDNGTGTVTLPPDSAAYEAFEDHLNIVNGLPPGSTIELIPSLQTYLCDNLACGSPGGNLGGEREQFDASLELQLIGTGALVGFQRNLTVPVVIETDSGPRSPGTSPQAINADLFDLQGSLPLGDPDFDQLMITAGTNNGLPSPGHSTLTQQSADSFIVDSFFDVSYQISFTGAPGGQLDGLSGTTSDSITLTAIENPSGFTHRITVNHDSISGSSMDIQFSGDLGSFSLDDDSDNTLQNYRHFSNVQPGSYQITAVLPENSINVDIVCVDPDMGSVVDVPGLMATIDLDFGENVECTFTAQERDIFEDGYED